MGRPCAAPTRRVRAMEDKRRRIIDAATALFADHGVNGVTTQQVSERADVAIGTLFRYAATKAELLILVQNEKFAAAIDSGLAARGVARDDVREPVEQVMCLLLPIIDCVREQPENGRTYMHELVFGDPDEPHRAAGLTQALRLEEAVATTLAAVPEISGPQAAALARVITAIIHLTMTSSVHLAATPDEIGQVIRTQLAAILPADTP